MNYTRVRSSVFFPEVFAKFFSRIFEIAPRELLTHENIKASELRDVLKGMMLVSIVILFLNATTENTQFNLTHVLEVLLGLGPQQEAYPEILRTQRHLK